MPDLEPTFKKWCAINCKVLRRFSKRIPELHSLSYNERLSALDLQRLDFRRTILSMNLFHGMLYGKISFLLCEFNITSSDNRAIPSARPKLHYPQVHTNIAHSFFACRCTRL